MRCVHVLAAVSLVPLAWTAAPAQEASTAVLNGRVFDASTAEPVNAARVRLVGAGREATTDESGRFRLAEVEPGAHLLEVRHLSYETVSDSIAVPGADEFVVEIRVAPDAIEIAPLVVEGRSAKLASVGFYERRETGLGAFVSREDLRERPVFELSDYMARMPGVRRVRQWDGTSRLQLRGRNTIMSDCRTQYILDGVPAEMVAAGIDEVSPEAVAGIEIYRGASEVPPRFAVGRAMCGVIVIWTRDGR